MICGAPLLLSLGIIQGYSDGAFQPNRDITQAQFAVIAIRFANETPGGTSLFSDANEDDWFCTQVTSAAQYGWIGGHWLTGGQSIPLCRCPYHNCERWWPL